VPKKGARTLATRALLKIHSNSLAQSHGASQTDTGHTLEPNSLCVCASERVARSARCYCRCCHSTRVAHSSRQAAVRMLAGGPRRRLARSQCASQSRTVAATTTTTTTTTRTTRELRLSTLLFDFHLLELARQLFASCSVRARAVRVRAHVEPTADCALIIANSPKAFAHSARSKALKCAQRAGGRGVAQKSAQ
jgi:hypothetical protein